MAYNPGGGSSSISGATDVALSSPTQGQQLSYDTSSQKWTNLSNTVYVAVIFFNSGTGTWPVRSSVGSPITVEWRGPEANRPPINSTYAKTGFDTFYATS